MVTKNSESDTSDRFNAYLHSISIKFSLGNISKLIFKMAEITYIDRGFLNLCFFLPLTPYLSTRHSLCGKLMFSDNHFYSIFQGGSPSTSFQ